MGPDNEQQNKKKSNNSAPINILPVHSVEDKKKTNHRKRKRDDKTDLPVSSNDHFSTSTDNQPKTISIPISNTESKHQSNSNLDACNNTYMTANKNEHQADALSSLSEEQEDSDQSKMSIEENAVVTEPGKKKRRKIPTITIKQLLDKAMVSVGDKVTYKGYTTQIDQDGFIGEPGTKGYSSSPSPWVTYVSTTTNFEKNIYPFL